MSRRSFPHIDPAALRDHADEARVERIWERVEQDVQSRLERSGPAAARTRRSALLTVALAAAFSAFGAGLWVGKATWDHKGPGPTTMVVTPVVDKSRVDVVAAGSQITTFPLEGGGRLTLSPGATAEVEHAGTDLTVSLLQGEASIDTTGRKRLAVVAGAARINTQGGSMLSVTRHTDDIDVKVDAGTVTVESPAGTAQLGKGERKLAVPIRTAVTSAPVDAPPRREPNAPLRPHTGPRPVPLKVAAEWLSRYNATADEDAAVAMLRKQGVNKVIDQSRSAAELFAIADIMRGKGRDPAAEVRALERLLRVIPSDQRAMLAADRLAAIYEAQGESARAKELREKRPVLAAGATQGSDALICALIRREPDKTKAALAAKEYLDKYPDGECRDDFERLLQEGAPTVAPDPAPSASALPTAPAAPSAPPSPSSPPAP